MSGVYSIKMSLGSYKNSINIISNKETFVSIYTYSFSDDHRMVKDRLDFVSDVLGIPLLKNSQNLRVQKTGLDILSV